MKLTESDCPQAFPTCKDVLANRNLIGRNKGPAPGGKASFAKSTSPFTSLEAIFLHDKLQVASSRTPDFLPQ